MSPVFDCTVPQARDDGISTASEAIFRGECVVMPTDTVYGIAADAFNPTAVAQLLEAKGRGREMPPPVLIPSRQTVDGLAMSVPSYAGRLMDAFWPGGLTLVFRAQQSLAWDLGDTNGTVGLRMPDDQIAISLLESTGPLAVSSANRTGKPSATTVTEAGFMLGHFVDVYLDGGERGADTSSTILDCTKADPVVLREGTISNEELRKVLGDVELITGRAVNSVVEEPIDLDKADEDDDAAADGADGADGADAADEAVDLTKNDDAAADTGDEASPSDEATTESDILPTAGPADDTSPPDKAATPQPETSADSHHDDE